MRAKARLSGRSAIRADPGFMQPGKEIARWNGNRSGGWGAIVAIDEGRFVRPIRTTGRIAGDWHKAPDIVFR